MCLEEFDFEKYKQLVAEDMAELKAALAKQKEETEDALEEVAKQKKETEAALADKDAEILRLNNLLAERDN